MPVLDTGNTNNSFQLWQKKVYLLIAYYITNCPMRQDMDKHKAQDANYNHPIEIQVELFVI